MRTQRATLRADWWSALTVATLAWGALAFGGVYGWAFWPLVLSSAALGTVGVVANRTTNPRGLAIMMVVIAVAIAAQLIPISAARLAALSPSTDRLLRQYDLPYAVGVAGHSLSIQPAETLVALASYIGFALLSFGTTRQLGASSLRGLMRGLVALGALVAFVGIVQEPLSHGRVYGVWVPFSEKANPFGPFINRNHFAGWMLMMLPLSLGYLGGLTSGQAHRRTQTFRERVLSLSSPEANEVVLVGFACIAMALALAMTRSKSGIGGLVVAMLVVGWCVVRHQPTPLRRLAAGAYVLLLFVSAFWLTGLDTIVFRFVEMDRLSPWEIAGRLDVWRIAARIASDFPLTGTGLGTFGVATLFYDPQAALRHFAQAHNDYLQLAAEGGVLLGLPIVLLVVAFVREARMRFREPRDRDRAVRSVRVGAVTALIAIGLQATVDFSLQMPGNAALFSVVCAIAIHAHTSSKSRVSQTTSARR